MNDNNKLTIRATMDTPAHMLNGEEQSCVSMDVQSHGVILIANNPVENGRVSDSLDVHLAGVWSAADFLLAIRAVTQSAVISGTGGDPDIMGLLHGLSSDHE